MGLAHGREGGLARAQEIHSASQHFGQVDTRGGDFMFGLATQLVLAHVLFLLGLCDSAAAAVAGSGGGGCSAAPSLNF